MEINRIKVRPPFSELFPIDPQVLQAVKEDMDKRGYDPSQPIILWTEKGVLIDGHTRLEAAKILGLEAIPVYEKSFRDEDAALLYAIHSQRDRRNLNQAELFKIIKIVDEICVRGEGQGRESGKYQPKASGDAIGKSAKKTAKIVGSSQATVERARAARSDPKIAEGVIAGRLSINQGAKEARAKKVKPPSASNPIQGREKSQAKVTEQHGRPDVFLRAWTELSAWREKYRECQELAVIFEFLDENCAPIFANVKLFPELEAFSHPVELGEPCLFPKDGEQEQYNYNSVTNFPVQAPAGDHDSSPSDVAGPEPEGQAADPGTLGRAKVHQEMCTKCLKFKASPGESGIGSCEKYSKFFRVGNGAICSDFKSKDCADTNELPQGVPVEMEVSQAFDTSS